MCVVFDLIKPQGCVSKQKQVQRSKRSLVEKDSSEPGTTLKQTLFKVVTNEPCPKSHPANLGIQLVHQTGIQCFNCKEFGHVATECKKAKWVKDSAYHKEKMMLCKQEEDGIELSVEQVDWKDETYDEPEVRN
nr:hypothetical protein [Tanacetum cinerariifolium]